MEKIGLINRWAAFRTTSSLVLERSLNDVEATHFAVKSLCDEFGAENSAGAPATNGAEAVVLRNDCRPPDGRAAGQRNWRRGRHPSLGWAGCFRAAVLYFCHAARNALL
jgi:hypothetical protein